MLHQGLPGKHYHNRQRHHSSEGTWRLPGLRSAHSLPAPVPSAPETTTRNQPGGAVCRMLCLLRAAASTCLFGCLRTAAPDPRLWAPLLMLTAMSLGRWFQFRPQLFTYLFLAFFVLILFRYLLGRSTLLWLLPLLMPLWVN